MNRALHLVDVSISVAPDSSPAPLSTMVPTLRARTVSSSSYATEPPPTQRCVTSHPRYETAARHEATNLLAVMRLNLDFLQTLLHGESAGLAASAISDLHQTVDRLERGLGSLPFSR